MHPKVLFTYALAIFCHFQLNHMLNVLRYFYIMKKANS